jgi:hypothetical protein
MRIEFKRKKRLFLICDNRLPKFTFYRGPCMGRAWVGKQLANYANWQENYCYLHAVVEDSRREAFNIFKYNGFKLSKFIYMLLKILVLKVSIKNIVRKSTNFILLDWLTCTSRQICAGLYTIAE